MLASIKKSLAEKEEPQVKKRSKAAPVQISIPNKRERSLAAVRDLVSVTGSVVVDDFSEPLMNQIPEETKRLLGWQ